MRISETRAREIRASQLMKQELLAPKVELLLQKLESLGITEEEIFDLSATAGYQGSITAINLIFEIYD